MFEKKWIYKLLKSNLHVKTMEEKMNDLANDGWKYMGSSAANDGPYLIFGKSVEVEHIDKVSEILKHVQKD